MKFWFCWKEAYSGMKIASKPCHEGYFWKCHEILCSLMQIRWILENNCNIVINSYFFEESTVELDDVGAFVASHYHIQIHEQLLLLLLVHSRPDSLGKETNSFSRYKSLAGPFCPPRESVWDIPMDGRTYPFISHAISFDFSNSHLNCINSTWYSLKLTWHFMAR